MIEEQEIKTLHVSITFLNSRELRIKYAKKNYKEGIHSMNCKIYIPTAMC